MRPVTSPLLPLAALLTTLVGGAGTIATAQEEPLPGAELAVDWPPSGERLRELAERQDIEIGFAARLGWQELPEAATYGAIAAAEFGILTPESSLKWKPLRPSEDSFDFGDVDRQVEFAESNDMELHGHPLTWYLLNPDWLDTVPADRLPEVLEEHVRSVVSRYVGRFSVWDVVNEGLNNEGTDLRDDVWTRGFGGTGYMDLAFRTAREADPDATLIYNDFDIGWLTEKSARALALVEELLGRGVPVDGVGMQMHLDHTFVHFEGFSEAMQRFADRDLDLYVTELDVRVLEVEDYAVQADVYEQVIRRCLMQPRCKAVQIWGLDDFYSWQPFFRPLPFDAEFRVKPAYFGMQRALMSEPVHPERCSLGGARVVSGAVYGASVDGEEGEPFELSCDGVELDGGFTSLSIRYRNPGSDTPNLTVRAGGTTLATIPLPPTIDSNDGDHRTVTVTVPPIEATTTLALALEGGAAGVDALLFADPTRPLLPGRGGTETGGATGADDGGAGPGTDGETGLDGDVGADGGADASGGSGAGGDEGADSGTDEGLGGDDTSGGADADGGSGTGGGVDTGAESGTDGTGSTSGVGEGSGTESGSGGGAVGVVGLLWLALSLVVSGAGSCARPVRSPSRRRGSDRPRAGRGRPD